MPWIEIIEYDIPDQNRYDQESRVHRRHMHSTISFLFLCTRCTWYSLMPLEKIMQAKTKKECKTMYNYLRHEKRSTHSGSPLSHMSRAIFVRARWKRDTVLLSTIAWDNLLYTKVMPKIERQKSTIWKFDSDRWLYSCLSWQSWLKLPGTSEQKGSKVWNIGWLNSNTRFWKSNFD